MPDSENSGRGDGNVASLARRDFFVRWGTRLACLAVASALAFGAWRGYGHWRAQHLGRQVGEFVAHGDYRSAVLVARRLLELDQNNLAACTAMAEMAEKTGRPEAIEWRQRVARLQPSVIGAQLALARAALRFGGQDLADHVLEAVPANARENVDYQGLAGALALAQKNVAAAENHFAAAAKLDPTNPHFALNLAFIHLASPKESVAAGARRDFAALAAQPTVRLESLRALTGDAVARNQNADAIKWATQLRTETDATFSDMLLCFRAFEGTDKALAVLNEAKTKAVAHATTTAELITWLNRNGMAIVAAHWSKSLPKNILETQPVPLAIAESYSFFQDWTSMQAYVEGKNWGEFEALRLAVESHALHHLAPADRPSTEAKITWQAALEAARHHPEQIVAIAQLGEGWGYQEEAEAAWWMVASGSVNATMGLSALQRLYQSQHDTHGLLRVAKRAMELNPADLAAANNCANLGLLLNGDSTARRLAARLHNEHPANRAFAATYAFALQTEGKLDDALKLMETLKEEELRNPSIAAYYFVMLVESGKLERARSFLPAAKRATLLPEEQQLLSAATRKLLAAETADTAKRVVDATTR